MKRHREVPLVFRIHNNPQLREDLRAFAEAESLRLGYRITPAEVAERAIREWLETQPSTAWVRKHVQRTPGNPRAG